MVVGIRFSVDDGEMPFSGCAKEKLLDCEGGGIRKDYFVGVDVFKCVGGNLSVDLIELVDYFFDAADYIRFKVAAVGVAGEVGEVGGR